MIRVETIGYSRVYTVPRALVAVAVEIFPGGDEGSSLFKLARRLTSDDLHTAENMALNVGHREAIEFARCRLAKKSALA